MKSFFPAICLAAAAAVSAQTAPKAATTAKPATTTAKAATTATSEFPTVYKLPADEKRIPGLQKTEFVLKYQDIKIGTGPAGEPGKLWHVNYRGWRAVDGVVFDQSADHKQPVMDKDGKPVMGPDGKPKLGDPAPLAFPQGMGRLIPGFDYGVTGMRIGGKRRIFIPWQIAYGTRAIPDRPDHPGIPAKSDLIFDVELVQVTEMPSTPAPPQRPGGPGAGGAGQPPVPRPATPPPATSAPAAPPTPATTAPATGNPPTPDTNAKPATPPPAQSQPSTPPQPK